MVAVLVSAIVRIWGGGGFHELVNLLVALVFGYGMRSCQTSLITVITVLNSTPFACILSHKNTVTLILFFRLRLGLPSGLFSAGFPTKTPYAFLLSPIRATCPAPLRLPGARCTVQTLLSCSCSTLERPRSVLLCSIPAKLTAI